MNINKPTHATKQFTSREVHEVFEDNNQIEKISSINSGLQIPLGDINHSSQSWMKKNQRIDDEQFNWASSNSFDVVFNEQISRYGYEQGNFYSDYVLKKKKLKENVNKNFPRIILNIIKLSLHRFQQDMQQENFLTLHRKINQLFKTTKSRCTTMRNLISLLQVSSYRNKNWEPYSTQIRRNLSRIIRQYWRANSVNQKNKMFCCQKLMRLKVYVLRCRNKQLITRCQI